MEKLYFKTEGDEPDENCTELCPYDEKPSKGTKIGSASCQDCGYCYGWDREEKWVKCLKHSLELQK